MNRQEYFSFSKRQDEFEKAFIKLLQRMLSLERIRLIPPENELKFKHGTKWVTTYSNVSQDERKMKKLDSVTNIYLKDISNHNLNLIESFMSDLVNQMIETDERMMYETISKMCEDKGRIIEQNNDKSPAEKYLEGIKSVEFSVGKDGRISLPTFHGNPETIELLKNDLESKGTDFHAELQKVINEKSAQALEKEKKRLERFKS